MKKRDGIRKFKNPSRTSSATISAAIAMISSLSLFFNMSLVFAQSTSAAAASTPPAPSPLPYIFSAFQAPSTQSPTGEINTDITRVFTNTAGTLPAITMLSTTRAMIEQLLINAFDANLYLQGVASATSGGAPDPYYQLAFTHLQNYCAPNSEGGGTIVLQI